MKSKKLLTCILSAALALTSVVFPAFAADESNADWNSHDGMTVVAYGINNGEDAYFKTLKDALTGVYKSNPENTVTLECKPDSDVGIMTHGHVADNLIINGNGAKVSYDSTKASCEGDMEFDTFKFNRSTGAQDQNGVYLDKDITVVVNNLGGIGAWGQRNTTNTLNLEFNNCENMTKIMFRSSENDSVGDINVTLNNCSFDREANANALPDTSVHITSPANIKLTGCTFKNIAAPVNLSNKSTKAQTIDIDGCTFTNCSTAEIVASTNTADYAAPIRFVTTSTGTINATVKNTSITGATCGNGDILIGDGRSRKDSTLNVTVGIEKTNAEVQMQYPGEADKTVTKKVTAESSETVSNAPAQTAVAKIGDTSYETLADAVNAANEGDTITIIGTINVTDEKELHNGTKAITIQGDTSDGEDVLHFKGAVAIHGAKVIFKDLTMQWPADENYVGLQHADSLTYHNCTIKGKVFLYGNKEIFNKCNFVQTVVDYNVWTYGAKIAEFNNCIFNCVGKSILIYNEDYNNKPVEEYINADSKKVVINNCTFIASEECIGKAAVEIDSRFSPFNVGINKSTAEGFSTSTNSKNGLYNVKNYNANITDPSQDKASLTVDNKEKAIRSTTFSSMTDSGLYTVENEKFGVMRFSFKVVPMGDVSAVGIKYAKGSDIAQAISGSVLSKSADLNVFYGDLVNIDPNENSTYYAIAYVTTTDGDTAWSDVVECTLDTNKEFDNYKVGGAE